MAFVIVTGKLSQRHFFQGALESPMFPSIVLTKTIFMAMNFDHRKDAEQAISDLNLVDDFEISEIVGVDMGDDEATS